MLRGKPAPTPIEPGYKPKNVWNTTPVDKLRYQKLVEKLIYLSQTRPDIRYATSIISQFMHKPTNEHFKASMRILRYLKNTPTQGLHFRKIQDRRVKLYIKADWTSSKTYMRSTTGYCTYVWGNIVT